MKERSLKKPNYNPFDQGKRPPSNVEAEDAVMGVLIQNPGLLDIAQRYLVKESFYENTYGMIYDDMCTLASTTGTFDMVTLRELYNQKGDNEGLMYRLQLLSSKLVPTVNLERHCMIVQELFLKRSCIRIMYEYSDKVFNNDGDIADVYDNIKSDLDKLFNITDTDVNRLVQYEKCILSACLTNEALLLQITNRLTTDLLYRTVNKDIYQAILRVMNDGKAVSVESVSDVLRKSNNNNALLEIQEIIKFPVDEWKYYLDFIIEQNNVKELNAIAMSIISHNYNKVDDLVERISDKIDTMRVQEVEVTSQKTAIKRTIANIRNVAAGLVRSFLQTTEKILNEVAFISPNNTVVVSGMSSSGKTRWMIHIIKGMLHLNKISILWFSMEDPDDKIIRSFISNEVGLTDAQMLSKNYVLSSTQLQAIEEASEKFDDYDIEFVTESSSIKTISSKFKTFCKKRKDQWCILIVDNFMLIQEVANATGNSTQVEDFVMSKIKSLRSDTNTNGMVSTIFLLHHLTKDVAMKANKEEGYRPKMGMLKGSTRIADTANIVIMINNIGQHKDLIREHSKLPDVVCIQSDGSRKLFRRSVLMPNMLIVEVVKNRDGEISDNKGIMRYIVDFSLMSFKHLNCSK